MEGGPEHWHVGTMTDDPDLRFLGLSLWIDGHQFPDADDYWDANWLLIRARMETNGARVECNGPILMTTDIGRFRDQLAIMVKTLKGEAALQPLEPDLKVVLRIQSKGQVEGTVDITPDHMTQQHSFTLDADQTYLPALIDSCDVLLTRFPIKNTAKI
jgi:hypothetical protein